MRRGNVTFFDYDLILIPIHQGNHWTLTVKETIFYQKQKTKLFFRLDNRFSFSLHQLLRFVGWHGWIMFRSYLCIRRTYVRDKTTDQSIARWLACTIDEHDSRTSEWQRLRRICLPIRQVFSSRMAIGFYSISNATFSFTNDLWNLYEKTSCLNANSPFFSVMYKLYYLISIQTTTTKKTRARERVDHEIKYFKIFRFKKE